MYYKGKTDLGFKPRGTNFGNEILSQFFSTPKFGDPYIVTYYKGKTDLGFKPRGTNFCNEILSQFFSTPPPKFGGPLYFNVS
jgi:hypothetical protein